MASNRFSTKPLYLQLRDALAECIAAGRWKPDTALSNENDLAREYGVSPGTIRKALDVLAGEHLLLRRQGHGTFVRDQSSGELAIRFSNIRGANGERISGEVGSSAIVEGTASGEDCARLQLRAQDLVYRIRRVRIHDGRPFMIEDAILPAALFPGLAHKNDTSRRIVVLAQQHGILLGKAQERLTIGCAALDVANALGIAPASSIMVLDRVVRTIDGQPVEWRIAQTRLGELYYMAEMD